MRHRILCYKTCDHVSVKFSTRITQVRIADEINIYP